MNETEKTSDHVLVTLFNGAIADLESVDLLTKDSVPAIRAAIEKLDDFHSRLRNFDSAIFPRGTTLAAIERIRGALRIPGQAAAALRDLRSLGDAVKHRMGTR